jgi:hypothetical protein
MTVPVAQVKMEVTSKPAELERVDRKILQPLGFTHDSDHPICRVHLTCDPILSRLEMERLSVGDDKDIWTFFTNHQMIPDMVRTL